MKSPVLLCYNLPEEKARQIRLLAMRMLVRVRPVMSGEYGETLAALCGMEALASTPAPEKSLEAEMLVLAHFSNDLLTRFLAGFRQAGITPVPLKAILTDTNAHWNSLSLFQELTAEHEALAAQAPNGKEMV